MKTAEKSNSKSSLEMTKDIPNQKAPVIPPVLKSLRPGKSLLKIKSLKPKRLMVITARKRQSIN